MKIRTSRWAAALSGRTRFAVPWRAFAVAATLTAVTVLAAPTPASAAPRCPDWHITHQYAICYYDSNNFTNLLDYFIVNESDCGTPFVISTSFRNRTNSVRNRTPCRVDLMYYCGTTSCDMGFLPQFTEAATLPSPNVLDWFATSPSF